MNSSNRFRRTSGHSLLHGRMNKVFPISDVVHVLPHGVGPLSRGRAMTGSMIDGL